MTTLSKNDELGVLLTTINDKLDLVLKKISLLEKKKNKNDKSKSSSDTEEKPVTKHGHVVIDRYNDHLKISGNTYDIKDIFKKYKSIWDGPSKSWKVNSNMFEPLHKNLTLRCLSVKVNDKTTVNNVDKKSYCSDEDNAQDNTVFEFLDEDE